MEGIGGGTMSEMYQSARKLVIRTREGIGKLERLESATSSSSSSLSSSSSAPIGIGFDSSELAFSIKKDVAQIQSLCADMDRLWRSIASKGQRDLWKRKVEQVAEEVDSLKESLDRFSMRQQKRIQEAKERAELIERVNGEDSHILRIFDDEAQAVQSARNSYMMLEEAYATGVAVLSKYAEQRDRLKSAQRKALDILNTVGLSNSVLKLVERRHRGDKWIAYAELEVIYNEECPVCLDWFVSGEMVRCFGCGHILHDRCCVEMFKIRTECVYRCKHTVDFASTASTMPVAQATSQTNIAVVSEGSGIHDDIPGESAAQQYSTLSVDDQCEIVGLPSDTIQILHGHQDEVWFVKFSNNGQYLASASKDRNAIVWEVHEDGKLSVKHTLTGHKRPVFMASWRPDDRQLLTCGFEEVIRRWNVSTGECLCTYQKDDVGFISCAWTLHGKFIISGTTDKSLFMWNLNGREVSYWRSEKLTTRTMDLALGKGGCGFICCNTNNCLGMVNTYKEYVKLINLENEDQAINSFSLSRDCELALLNLENDEIVLCRIVGVTEPLMRFKGHRSSGFLTRSCLGGFEDTFVATGSEDSQIYVWHATTGKLISKLLGHSDAVNCVSWNPVNTDMFASASSDKTIRIWGTKLKRL